MMKMKLLPILSAGLLLCTVVHAQQVISYFAEIPASPSNWAKTVHLPGFDSDLGTLTQVKLSYTGEVRQALYAENLSDSCAQYDLSTTATLALAKAGGATLFSPMPVTLNRSGKLSGYDGTTDFAHSSGIRFTQDFMISGTYLDADLAGYLGSAGVDFSASASALSFLNSGGNFIGGASNSAATSLTVEYSYRADFAPIPEPSAYASVLGAAAIAFVAFRRRRAILSV